MLRAPHATCAWPRRTALTALPLLLSLTLAAGAAHAVPETAGAADPRPASPAAEPEADRKAVAEAAPEARALPGVTYTAHRGGALEVPENSLSGLTRTFRHRKADVLDVDVRRLRDGKLVALHDRTLDRTTNAHGPVKRLTLRQWKRVLITPSPKLPGRWKPEHPPTLNQVLRRFGGRTTLLLELKDRKGLKRLSWMLHKKGLTRSVYVQSNKPRFAVKAHKKGLLTSVWRGPKQIRGDHVERWTRNVDMLSVDYRARGHDVRRAVASGIDRVWSHTVNTRAARDRMLGHGVSGIVTDAPTRLAR